MSPVDYPIFHGERGGTDADTFSRGDFLRKNEKLVGVSCDVRGCASMAKQQVDSRLVTVKVFKADGIEGERAGDGEPLIPEKGHNAGPDILTGIGRPGYIPSDSSTDVLELFSGLPGDS